MTGTSCVKLRYGAARCAVMRGFNLVEMLIALAISAALLAATMVALDASCMAYQTTTEVASTHTIGRLTMHRLLALIRTGSDFAPVPDDPRNTLQESDWIQFTTPDGQILMIEWLEDVETGGALYVTVNDGSPYKLLEGVLAQDDVHPFTLEYEQGCTLHRATVDLLIRPDDNMDLELEGDSQQQIHLVASAMPRGAAFK